MKLKLRGLHVLRTNLPNLVQISSRAGGIKHVDNRESDGNGGAIISFHFHIHKYAKSKRSKF